MNSESIAIEQHKENSKANCRNAAMTTVHVSSRKYLKISKLLCLKLIIRCERTACILATSNTLQPTA
jgi:hypothetical protein